MKNINIILICLAIFISGCATAKQVSGPAGETLYSIDCSGTYLNVGDCLKKAGEICGKSGYEIIGGLSNNLGNAIAGNQYGIFSSPIITREIIIQCKK